MFFTGDESADAPTGMTWSGVLNVVLGILLCFAMNSCEINKTDALELKAGAAKANIALLDAQEQASASDMAARRWVSKYEQLRVLAESAQDKVKNNQAQAENYRAVIKNLTNLIDGGE